MSKAFTTENDEVEDPDLEEQDVLPAGQKNYMTPRGFAAMQDEFHHLLKEERPKIVEIVSWAAGNGDRSENGDYLYGKKRLREIDRRLRYLTKRIENAEVVDPKKQKGLTKVFFGATVTYADQADKEHTITLVGIDETQPEIGRISWVSPIARAVFKAQAGDVVRFRTPAGIEEIEIVSVEYISE